MPLRDFIRSVAESASPRSSPSRSKTLAGQHIERSLFFRPDAHQGFEYLPHAAVELAVLRAHVRHDEGVDAGVQTLRHVAIRGHVALIENRIVVIARQRGGGRGDARIAAEAVDARFLAQARAGQPVRRPEGNQQAVAITDDVVALDQ